MPSTYRLSRWLWGSLDWLLPPRCGGCGRTGYRWCPDCHRNVKMIPEPVCRTCSMPVPHAGQCARCLESPPPFENMRSWAYFDGPIRRALHQLKYHRDIGLGDALALSFESFIRDLGWTVDMLIPVPLGSERMKERGYNQVGLIARPLARAFTWHYKPHGLKRSRETKSQVGLTILERQENVRGAFRAESAIVSGARVLLMDDVATTGATLSECARALLSAGAKAVSAVTIAHALWSDRTVE